MHVSVSGTHNNQTVVDIHPPIDRHRLALIVNINIINNNNNNSMDNHSNEERTE